MNLTPSQIYWILQADKFITFGFVVSLLLFIFSLGCLCIASDQASGYCHEADEWKKPLKIGLSLVATAMLLALIALFAPSTKTLTTMSVLPSVPNNETTQKTLPDDVKELIKTVTTQR